MRSLARSYKILAIILILALSPTLAVLGGAESESPFNASYGTRVDSAEKALSVSLAGTPENAINGHWTSAIPASATDFALSLTMERVTPAAPSFNIQIVGTDKKSTPYTLLSLDSANGVWLLSSTDRIITLGEDALDLVLGVTIAWEDSLISIDVYLDGAFLGSYSDDHFPLTGCQNYLQFTAAASSNGHINEANGTLLLDGINEDGEDETRTTFYESDPEGYYGIVKLSDITVASSYERRNFIYPGASMRLKDDASESGLRFTFGVDKAWYDALEGASVGAILLPTDKLNGAAFSPELLSSLEDTDYIDLPAGGFHHQTAPEANDATYVYYTSLISLREQNYARSITAVGYVRLADGSVIYTATQSRSIYEVAANASASGDFKGSIYESQLHGYLDRVVVINSTDGGFAMSTIANYDSPYLFSSTESGFTLEGDVGTIKAIILDGVVYTGGWDGSDGVIRINLK